MNRRDLTGPRWRGVLGDVLDGVVPDAVRDEVRMIWRNPRLIGQFLEHQSPWLNRHVLSAASNLSEPFLVGMGLRVAKLGEESIEVVLPSQWKNRAQSSQIHVGAIVTLGELASRLFWEHHLDLKSTEMVVEHIEFKRHKLAVGSLRGVFRLSEAEREKVMHELRDRGAADVTSSVSIYDLSERLVAEVEVRWDLRRQVTLSGSRR